ncbi:hypothetical protein C3L33_07479, partial [Rhododendron williamsianum]
MPDASSWSRFRVVTNTFCFLRIIEAYGLLVQLHAYRYSTDPPVTIMSSLLEGLPDAVALGPELFKARKEVNSSEDYLCVCAFDPENLWQLYDPRRDHWITLPVLPSKIRQLANFGVVSADGKLFVLGGGSDAVDPSTGDHDGIFATDEIVVAGGFTSFRKSISKAEIYDPEKDVWGFGWFEPRLDGSRLRLAPGSKGGCKGIPYVMSHGILFKQEIGARKVVASASEFRRRIGFAMIALGNDIYVIGGVIGPERWNSGITKLSDVNVLTIGTERPIWRRVAPMTRCNGTILGCTQLRI